MRVLITADQIATRINALGKELSEVYQGQPLTVVGVLSGSVLFLADLMRQLQVPHQIGFVQAASYRNETRAGELSINSEFFPQIEDRDVLLIDDIFDTGRTLAALQQRLQTGRPRSLSSAVLLWKETEHVVSIRPQYFGFKIPNEFVVGYGLDYRQNYRHLPYIAVLDEQDL